MRLEELNSRYNAFITIKEIKGNSEGKLSGLTFGVKDVILTKDVRTTAGSKILENYVPNKNAYIVDVILREGGVILGKTNTHEFALGATNTSSIAGPAKNPYDDQRISGGSSGGSAVAVGLGLVDVGIGTDTGGSVRVPASLCGVIGFKPTTGLIPTDGVIPFSWTLDTIGFLAKDVDVIYKVFSTVLPNDKKKVVLSKLRRRPRLGLFMFNENNEVSKVLLKGLDKISSYFDLINIDLPLLKEHGSRVRRIIGLAEASSYHRDWLINYKDKYYFKDTYSLLINGLNISAVDYIDSLRFRRELLKEYLKIFKEIDFILSPTTTITAPKISEVINNELKFRDSLISITELFNVVGAPSISVPFAEINGLPIGLMISGELYKDGDLLEFSRNLMEIYNIKVGVSP